MAFGSRCRPGSGWRVIQRNHCGPPWARAALRGEARGRAGPLPCDGGPGGTGWPRCWSLLQGAACVRCLEMVPNGQERSWLRTLQRPGSLLGWWQRGAGHTARPLWAMSSQNWIGEAGQQVRVAAHLGSPRGRTCNGEVPGNPGGQQLRVEMRLGIWTPVWAI